MRAKTSVQQNPITLIYGALGFVLFGIGALGLFLPVLPTTVFWIGAVYFFARSHPAMAARIYAWPKIGMSVEGFVEEGRICRAGKIAAVLGMSASALILVLTLSAGPALWLALGVIAASALYVVTRPG